MLFQRNYKYNFPFISWGKCPLAFRDGLLHCGISAVASLLVKVVEETDNQPFEGAWLLILRR